MRLKWTSGTDKTKTYYHNQRWKQDIGKKLNALLAWNRIDWGLNKSYKIRSICLYEKILEGYKSQVNLVLQHPNKSKEIQNWCKEIS